MAADTTGLVADRYLYLTRDGNRLVEQGAPDAVAYLLAGPGTLIPADEVKRLRLQMTNGRIEQAPAVEALAEPPRRAPRQRGE